MKKILITGGTGSLGSFLTKRWAAQGHQITVVSRNPHRQSELSKEVDACFILSDICNEGEMVRACRDQDILIHTAALKQVDVGEYHPIEYARVNVQGSITVVQAWAETHPNNSGLALGISSDKAVSSLNCYGASKKLLESVFRKYKYSVLRYGNVVESRGSFFHQWGCALKKKQPLMVRTPEPTRFFLTLNEAAELVEDVLIIMERAEYRWEGGIFVPHSLPAFSIHDVAIYLDSIHGTGIKFEPLLPYEKMDESLAAPGEGPIEVSDLLSVITPTWNIAPEVLAKFCSLTAPRMTAKEVLRRGNWIL